MNSSMRFLFPVLHSNWKLFAKGKTPHDDLSSLPRCLDTTLVLLKLRLHLLHVPAIGVKAFRCVEVGRKQGLREPAELRRFLPPLTCI